MTNNSTDLYDDRHHGNDTVVVADDNKNVIIDWLATWSYARENSEQLILYSVIATCLGAVALLLAVIFYLVYRRHRPRRHHLILHSSSSYSDKKYSSPTHLSSASTQTTQENASLLPPDSPDRTWVKSPTTAATWAPSNDSPSPRLVDPSSSPSTLRSIPLRMQSGPGTVGGDPVWKTLDRQGSRSPNAALYTNPYRHDIFRTIDSRSTKSPHK